MAYNVFTFLRIIFQRQLTLAEQAKRRIAELDRKQEHIRESLEAVRKRADALKLLLLAMRGDGG